MKLEEFGLQIDSDWISESYRSFRPPSWPPPRDWVVCEDRERNVMSRWGDAEWDLSPWAGRVCKLRFGDGPSLPFNRRIDDDNADLLRLLTTWRIWGPRSVKTTSALLGSFFNYIRPIVATCSQEGILVSELMQFPRVQEKVISRTKPSRFNGLIAELHRIWDSRDLIGFFILDKEGIRSLASHQTAHLPQQTAYIPPRIWNYQVERLKTCLEDFLSHQNQIEDCFNFCVDAYAHNCNSLQAAMTSKITRHRLPFREFGSPDRGAKTGCKYFGLFEITAEKFGIVELLRKWVCIPKEGLELRQLSQYLSLIQFAGLAYIACFTLQRINEVASLRSDCLNWEEDEKLGRIAIICGETTKTEMDADARWPTSPSVEIAVTAMASIARLRIRCAAAHPDIQPSAYDIKNPYLFDRSYEPWGGAQTYSYHIRRSNPSYATISRLKAKLYELEQLVITEEDLKFARMLTPCLDVEKRYSVGRVWPLAWHQLRRTGAVNMFASGLISDSSIQFQMKHSSRLMPLYYGRGYTKLQLNREVENVVIATCYETLARNLHSTMSDRFVSPHGERRKDAIVVALVSNRDIKTLSSAAINGETSFREIRLGGCTKRGVCSYGGIESIARCSGGDGEVPCADVLYDRARAPEVEEDLSKIKNSLKDVNPGSPRHNAILSERKGMENFLNVVKN